MDESERQLFARVFDEKELAVLELTMQLSAKMDELGIFVADEHARSEGVRHLRGIQTLVADNQVLRLLAEAIQAQSIEKGVE